MPFTRVSSVAYGALALCLCTGPALVACGGGQTFDDGGDPLSSTDEERAAATDTAAPDGADSPTVPSIPDPGADSTPADPGSTPMQPMDTATDDDPPMETDTPDTDDTATDSESEPDGGGGNADDPPDAGVAVDAGCETCDDAADAAFDETVDASDVNGGCANARVGSACEPEGLSCSDHCTDRCMFCNIMVCSEGTWASFEVFPEPCFDCGDALCSSSVEYCLVRTPAIPEAPAVYECRLSPEDCVDDGCSCQPGATTMTACEEP